MKRLGVSILGTVVGFGIGLEAQSPTPPPAFKPLVANAAPSRTCESRANVTLPNTTIESASVDQGDQTIGQSCRVTAVLTHPPAGDKVRILLAFPINDWNGRFQGVAGGGFSGGSPMAILPQSTVSLDRALQGSGQYGRCGEFRVPRRIRCQPPFDRKLLSFRHLCL